MTFTEEVQLAKEFGIPNPRHFVIDAKINYALSITAPKGLPPTRSERMTAIRRQLREVRSQIKDLDRAILNIPLDGTWQKKYHRDFMCGLWSELSAAEKKLKVKLKYMTNAHKQLPANNLPTFNIARLKEIPINTIVEVNSAGFFKVRDEKTPSCKWYRDNNTWVDFGDDNKQHDVIDLVMLLNKCSFIEACKRLS